jgi:hypothetical protein
MIGARRVNTPLAIALAPDGRLLYRQFHCGGNLSSDWRANRAKPVSPERRRRGRQHHQRLRWTVIRGSVFSRKRTMRSCRTSAERSPLTNSGGSMRSYNRSDIWGAVRRLWGRNVARLGGFKLLGGLFANVITDALGVGRQCSRIRPAIRR